MHTQTKGAQTCHHKADKAFKQSSFNLFHSVLFIFIANGRRTTHARPNSLSILSTFQRLFLFCLSASFARAHLPTTAQGQAVSYLSPSFDRGHYSYTQYRDKGVKLKIGNTRIRTIIHAHTYTRVVQVVHLNEAELQRRSPRLFGWSPFLNSTLDSTIKVSVPRTNEAHPIFFVRVQFTRDFSQCANARTHEKRNKSTNHAHKKRIF